MDYEAFLLHCLEQTEFETAHMEEIFTHSLVDRDEGRGGSYEVMTA